jgi:hypothetical protein
MAFGKRTEFFLKLQSTKNISIAQRKRWKLVLDGGIHWNTSYIIIRRTIELKDVFKAYMQELDVSKENLDIEIAQGDYLTTEDWNILELIRDQLQLLFLLTKNLERNPNLKEKTTKLLYGVLWEVLPTFEKILSYFEDLQTRAAHYKFDDNPQIQSSIILA